MIFQHPDYQMQEQKEEVYQLKVGKRKFFQANKDKGSERYER